MLPADGAVSCGPALLQPPDSLTVNVRCAETSGAQSSAKRATTYQPLAPLGSASTIDAVLVVPARNVPSAVTSQTSYSIAPVTALQEKATGEVTFAPFAGARSAGGTVEQPGVSARTFVVADELLFAGTGS